MVNANECDESMINKMNEMEMNDKMKEMDFNI